MRKALLALLLFGSTQAMAAGQVIEQSAAPKTLKCDPPTTRQVDSTGVNQPLTIGEIDYNEITMTNTTTTIAETFNTPADCTRVMDFSAMALGQYEITVKSIDTDGRIGADSEIFSFLLVPTVMPPSAPTGITLQ
mgnify:FL=1